MYPDWYLLVILAGTSTCHECKACIVDTYGGAQSLVKHSTPVKLGHPILAQVDVYDQLATTPQDKAVALRTAKTLLPLVLV